MPPTAAAERRITRDGMELTPEWFTGTLTLDPAFEKLAADQKKGRLARFIYEFDCMDVVGENRRVYPAQVWTDAASVLNGKAGRGRVWGRLDHPSYYADDALLPTLRDAVVRIVSVEAVEGKKAKVVMDVIDNPDGEKLMSLRAVGGDPCISQRALAIWEAMTDAEKLTYGLSKEQDGAIARGLRLITFDVVSQPGFDAAGTPVVTESKQEQEGPAVMKNLAELKAAFPNLVTEAIQEGIEQGKKLVDKAVIANEAITAEKPKIVKEATDPLNTQIADLTSQRDGLKAAFEAIKPQLVKAGIAFEQVSDKELLNRLEKANADRLAFENSSKTEKARADEAEKKLKDREAKDASEAAMKPVREKYANSPFKEQIFAAASGKATEREALEAAALKVAEIKLIQKNSGMGVMTDEAFEGKRGGNPADPNAPSTGIPGNAADESTKERVSVGAAFGSAGL